MKTIWILIVLYSYTGVSKTEPYRHFSRGDIAVWERSTKERCEALKASVLQDDPNANTSCTELVLDTEN